MTSDLTQHELAAALDQVVDEVLDEAKVHCPPVDASAVAAKIGLIVARDHYQPGRARFVRLSESSPLTKGSILVRPEPRPERMHWAIAHEIGESRVEHVFQRLSMDPHEVSDTSREHLANQFAKRLLLPGKWFEAHAVRVNWDLLALKARYVTASHELIARRMLDCDPPAMITLFDHGELTWRKSNVQGHVGPLMPVEDACWRRASAIGVPHVDESSAATVQAWPIHEPDWRREILRTTLLNID